MCSSSIFLTFLYLLRNMELKPQITTGSTDARYLRIVGVPALGFSPINNTPRLAHDHNEFLNKDIFLRGIEIYQNIIPEVANVSDNNEDLVCKV